MSIVYDVAAIQGQQYTLSCDATGASFAWQKYRSNRQWDSLYNDDRYGGTGTVNLIIKNFDISKAGVYRCYSVTSRNFFKEYGSEITVTLSVNGQWGQWSSWSYCTVTCGGGIQKRSRICNNPYPSGGGFDCYGDREETHACSVDSCSEWSHWYAWQQCSVNCGYGKRLRYRHCQQCSPCVNVDETRCSGLSYENEKCSSIPCQGRLLHTLTIGCDLGTTGGTLFWNKYNNRNVLQDSSKYSGFNSPHLTITSLKYNDDGSYRCLLSSGTYGNYTSISVYGKPHVTIPHTTYAVKIGGNVTLVCNIQSNPTETALWWTYNQAQNITISKRRYSGGDITDHNLSINGVKDSDSGVYTCNAQNIEGTAEATTQLITGNLTQTTILPDYYIAIAGQDITLECHINPDSSNILLYWLKGTTDLRSHSKLKYMNGTLNHPSLTIKGIAETDAGNYTCKLENTFGNSEDYVELKVLSVNVIEPLNIYLRANTTVTLRCEATGGVLVSWRRNGKKIVTTSSVRYSGGTVNTPALTISNVTRSHSGNYTCETSYDLVKVTSKKAIQLFIRDIPLVHQSLDNIQATTGDTIQLKCGHESYPVPISVFWKKDGENINVSDSKYNGSSMRDPHLTIFNTEQSDSGIYVCGVGNEIGTGFGSNIELIIQDPEKTSSALASAVGGVVGAIVVFVAVFIICIVFRRRQNSHQKNTKRQKVNTKLNTSEQAIQYRP
ncbi:Hypothetical predicted protein, partial [Mytilus galloprovincialis]